MKIDLVYLWCDGLDPVWRKKRESYLPVEKKRDVQTFCEGRIFNNDELRYSLRSVEMYAPWINHIYIVTDNQYPDWLDTSNEKITVINQNDLLPNEVLPTFNSCAIELCIHKIEGLSEYYLYANDDMMFGNKVTPDFFFTCSGKVKCRFLHSELTSAQQVEGKTYEYTIMRVNETISSDYNRSEMIGWQPHHNIDAYKKSSVVACLERYQQWSNTTLKNRFRTPDDMQRHIFSIHAVATGDASARLLEHNVSGLSRYVRLVLLFCGFTKCDSRFFDFNNPQEQAKVKLLKPYLICFNDNEFTTNEDRQRTREMLHYFYPNKSKFEL